MKKFKIFLFLLTMLSFEMANAQIGSYFDKFRPAKRWSAGIQVSPTTFHGDADDTKMGFSFGGHIKYSVSQSFALKFAGFSKSWPEYGVRPGVLLNTAVGHKMALVESTSLFLRAALQSELECL